MQGEDEDIFPEVHLLLRLTTNKFFKVSHIDKLVVKKKFSYLIIKYFLSFYCANENNFDGLKVHKIFQNLANKSCLSL